MFSTQKFKKTVGALVGAIATFASLSPALASPLSVEFNGQCGDKVAYGIIYTTGADCRAIGGATNGYAPDTAWTACHVNFCTDGQLKPAAVGSCNDKKAYGIVPTTGATCRTLGGAMNGVPGDHQITYCHLDWCTDSTLSIVPKAEHNQVPAWINMTAKDCRSAGGGIGGYPQDHHWIWCEMGIDLGPAKNACESVTNAHDMTEACAEQMWREAGCTTVSDHSGWRAWATQNNLSLEFLRYDFNLWSTLESEGHVQGCQSSLQMSRYETATEQNKYPALEETRIQVPESEVIAYRSDIDLNRNGRRDCDENGTPCTVSVEKCIEACNFHSECTVFELEYNTVGEATACRLFANATGGETSSENHTVYTKVRPEPTQPSWAFDHGLIKTRTSTMNDPSAAATGTACTADERPMDSQSDDSQTIVSTCFNTAQFCATIDERDQSPAVLRKIYPDLLTIHQYNLDIESWQRSLEGNSKAQKWNCDIRDRVQREVVQQQKALEDRGIEVDNEITRLIAQADELEVHVNELDATLRANRDAMDAEAERITKQYRTIETCGEGTIPAYYLDTDTFVGCQLAP